MNSSGSDLLICSLCRHFTITRQNVVRTESLDETNTADLALNTWHHLKIVVSQGIAKVHFDYSTIYQEVRLSGPVGGFGLAAWGPAAMSSFEVTRKGVRMPVNHQWRVNQRTNPINAEIDELRCGCRYVWTRSRVGSCVWCSRGGSGLSAMLGFCACWPCHPEG